MKPALRLLALARGRRRPGRGRLRRRLGRRSAATRASAAAAAEPDGSSLVAYSTPQVVYDEIIPRLPEDRRRARASPSRPPTAPRATRAAPSRPARRPTSSRSPLEPDMTRLVEAGLVAGTWKRQPDQGPVSDLGRRVHRAQGQPEAHQDLGRPAQARASRSSRRTRSPRARRSGTCSPPTAQAADGGKTRRPGLDYVAQADHQARQGAGQVGPRGAADLHRRARATCCSPTSTRRSTAQKKGEDVDYVMPDDTIKIDIDDRRDQGRRRPRRRPSSTTCCPSRRQEQLRRAGATARSTRRCSRRTRPSSRPARPVHDRGPRRLGKVNDEFFDPEKGAIAKIEEDAGVSTAK